MPDGPLFNDQSVGSPTVSCPIVAAPGKKKKKKVVPTWTVNELLDNLKKCDGGLDIFNKAKAANGGSDPTIVQHASVIKSGGDTDVSTGKIRLDPEQSKCLAQQTLVFELTNLSNKQAFLDEDNAALAGDRSRDSFIKGQEEIEFRAAQNSLKAFDNCAKTWGCKGPSNMEFTRSAKTFDDEFKRIANRHKEIYGKFWDKHLKDRFEKKHGSNTEEFVNPPHKKLVEDSGRDLSPGAAAQQASDGGGAGGAIPGSSVGPITQNESSSQDDSEA